jgi:hypothetical protein
MNAKLQIRPHRLQPLPWLHALAVLLLWVVLPGGAQVSPGNPQPKLATQLGNSMGGFEPVGDIDLAEAERRLNRLNAQRQRELVADTEKLLKLTTDFNAEVAQTNPAQLTHNQLRRLAEIEKLAHSVKEKMSMAVGDGPVFRDPPFFSPMNR